MDNNSNVANNEAKEIKQDCAVIVNMNGEKVDTTTGEVLNQENNAESTGNKEITAKNDNNKEVTAKENGSKEPEKRPMTESEAREYVVGLGFKHIDVKELYELMQVPSYSRYEFRMAAFIIFWARRHNIEYKFDKKGNIYLTKGTLAEGEYYPCVTSHMDTVQDKAKPYILAGAELPLRTRRCKSTTSDEVRHEIFIDGQGIGADDKLGVFISLQLMKKFDKIKAVFFVEEEVGMLGSKELEPEWFDDVAYVIGWDSPDLLRAAWKCSGTRLFSKDFYVNHLQPVVKRWGFEDKNFRSEPFTDVIQIREKTGIMCMNFGNGGYNAHMSTEYLVIEHVDHACGMGEDIIKSIGNKTQFKSVKKNYTYDRTATGINRPVDTEINDDAELSKIFGEYRYSYGTTNFYGGNTSSSVSTTNRSDGHVNNSTKQNGEESDNTINEEVVKYVVDTYEQYINDIKDKINSESDVIVDSIKDKFREAGIDFSTFDIDIKGSLNKIFEKKISF